jgi:hypothetical protein
MTGLPWFTHFFLKVIWHVSAWVIWKEWNSGIFTQKDLDLYHLTDNVKCMSFLWLKVNKLTFAFSYNDWWRHPLHCMCVIVKVVPTNLEARLCKQKEARKKIKMQFFLKDQSLI